MTRPPKNLTERVRRHIKSRYKGKVLRASRSLGVTNSTLALIYDGTTKSPRLGMLRALAADMGCTIDELIREEQ